MDVLILVGSKSDMEIAERTAKIMKDMGISYDIKVASAHRTPERVKELVTTSDANVFVCIAGLAAALPGVVSSHTIKPVIGVPVSGKINLDAILSMVQMPSGVPVATVGLDSGENAGLLAARILALTNDSIRKNIQLFMEKMRSQT